LINQQIIGTPGATFSITYQALIPNPVAACNDKDKNNSSLTVTVEGQFPVGPITHRRQISRILRVCDPPGPGGVVTNRLRVRAVL
jgi:hypothetical protein